MHVTIVRPRLAASIAIMLSLGFASTGAALPPSQTSTTSDGQSGSSIYGNLYDGETGGATGQVVLYNLAGDSVASGNVISGSGWWSIDNVPDGQYRLFARAGSGTDPNLPPKVWYS